MVVSDGKSAAKGVRLPSHRALVMPTHSPNLKAKKLDVREAFNLRRKNNNFFVPKNLVNRAHGRRAVARADTRCFTKAVEDM